MRMFHLGYWWALFARRDHRLDCWLTDHEERLQLWGKRFESCLMWLRRPAIFAVTALLTIYASWMGLAPRVAYYGSAHALETFVPVRPPVIDERHPQLLDAISILVSWALLPLLIHSAWRASRALLPLSPRPGWDWLAVPIPIWMNVGIALVMPAWLPPLTAAFGPFAEFVGFVFFICANMSALAFVTAAAQVDAENQGQTPHTLLWHVFHQLGGAPGTRLARRLFPESEACQEMAETMPQGVMLLAAAVMAGLMLKQL